MANVKEACKKISMNQTKINDSKSANVTICNHMYDDSQSLVQYLYEEGKCGLICREGKNIHHIILSFTKLLAFSKYYVILLIGIIFWFVAPKCFCNDDKEILCQTDGILRPSGQCRSEETCNGPSKLEFAECGKSKLCEPGISCDYHNEMRYSVNVSNFL